MARELNAEHFSNFPVRDISSMLSSMPQHIHQAPFLYVTELITCLCVSGQGESQKQRGFSASLFQVIINKAQ